MPKKKSLKAITIKQAQERALYEAEQNIIDKAIALIRPVEFQRMVQEETGNFLEIDRRQMLQLFLDLESAVTYHNELALQ